MEQRNFTDHGDGAMALIFDELLHAEAKHPDWPEDVVHQVAVLVEEAGEAMRAALNLHYEGGSVEDLRKELAQAGAMSIRALIHLPQQSQGARRLMELCA